MFPVIWMLRVIVEGSTAPCLGEYDILIDRLRRPPDAPSSSLGFRLSPTEVKTRSEYPAETSLESRPLTNALSGNYQGGRPRSARHFLCSRAAEYILHA